MSLDTIAVDSEQAVAEAVAAAAADSHPLELVAAGTKTALGRPMQAARRLELGGLAGIIDYQPEELILTARPGTPLAEVETALARSGQMLAFEPRDLSAVLGSAAGPGQTLGGVVAANLAGPRRCVAGAVRDHLLGVQAVNGLGQIFKAGGKVVKNVTGYDLCKVLTGSFGTLAAFTELTFKVLPAPETEETIVVPGLGPAAAVRLMNAALGGPAAVSSAAWLPPDLGAISTVAPGLSLTLLRLEGFGPSVAARRVLLTEQLERGQETFALTAPDSASAWRRLRDVLPFAGHADAPPGGWAVWKVSLKPSDAPAWLERLKPFDDMRLYLDWAGALAWVALPCGEDAQAAALRATLPEGAHAMLVAAPAAVRAAQAVFHPLPPALDALEARLKASFDPKGIFNPGRMVASR